MGDDRLPPEEKLEDLSGNDEGKLDDGEGDKADEAADKADGEKEQPPNTAPVVGYGMQPRLAPIVSMACCFRGPNAASSANNVQPSPSAEAPASQRRSSDPRHEPAPQEPATRRLTYADSPSPTPARKPSLRSNSSGEASPAKRESSHDGASSTGTGRRKINLF